MMDIKHHWIRDMVSSSTVVNIVHVSTEGQRADFLTKTLRCDIFCLYVSVLMVLASRIDMGFGGSNPTCVTVAFCVSHAPMKNVSVILVGS